jgi:putative Holliday junction resolvase
MTPSSRPPDGPSGRSGRILAIDPGEKRIGVASGDLRTGVAVPLTTLDAGPDPVETVCRLAEEEGAAELVVGIAVSLSGALGPQGQRGRELAEALARRLDVPVHTWDERLTTAEARRRGAPGGRKRRKGSLDAAAAAIILQAYLDSRRRPAQG